LGCSQFAGDSAGVWATKRAWWPKRWWRFLWPRLPQGFDVISEIVWDKKNFGLGKFPRPQHEILLVCRRGSLPFRVNNAGSVQPWHAPRAKNNGGRIHSAKPDGSLDLIEAASPGPYVELFARRARFGWDYWGDRSFGTAEMVA
jgi:N6-adenosine-specific RNA methylase IME4